MKFVYLLMSQPSDSAYLFTQMVDEAVPTGIYAIYDNMQSAVYALYEIYTHGYAGVRTGNEFVIIKREVRTLHNGVSE
tara:strand:- start:295 stop:528 length:234 start_codon:yes stop_codon:yes gene_type:complete